MEKQYIDTLNAIITNHFRETENLKILEAGCGSVSHIKVKSNWLITGIDISQKQLDRNKRLSEKICADIQNYPLNKELFDIVISWYVLEHVKNPRKAMANFINTLQSNGLLIIALPNLWSIKGIVAKLTPTIVHIWFYKYILKNESAGKDDVGPFKTYLKLDISPRNMKKFALKHNLEVIHFNYSTVTGMFEKIKKNVIAHIFMKIIGGIFWILSFGKIKEKETEFLMVLKKLPET